MAADETAQSVAPATYPDEPWYLGGALAVSVFLVPAAELPVDLTLPQGRRPLRLGSRAVVGVAAAKYVDGGALAYDELLVAIPSVGRGGLRVTIPQIWVDSPSSLRGGRALWGIPKELARFDRSPHEGGRTVVSVTGDSGPIADLRERRGARLVPGIRQVPLPILQILDGEVKLSINRIFARISGLRASWVFASGGPLSYLRGRRPVFNISLHDASIVFGATPTRMLESNR